jgi:hypothetical protein
MRVPVMYYDSNCSGALDYKALSTQIHKKLFGIVEKKKAKESESRA